jgi:hypothetical protein
MRIGSQAHKELFCRTFFEGHVKYEPPELPWPELDDDALAMLRSLPFWTHARQFESDAGPMIRAVAAVEPDPLIREALELQAFEEERHARLVDYMIDLYQLPAEEAHVEVPADPMREFIDFGFEECLDSFGSFGLFKIARDTEFVPDPLFDVFDNVMREESHHIVFFINWFAHRQANRGLATRLLRIPKSLVHYAKALGQIKELMSDDDGEEGADFVVKGAEAFVDNLTPHLVINACVSENERRLAGFDRRLIVPSLVPRLAAFGGAVLKLVPERLFTGGDSSDGSAQRSKESTPRAA